MQTPASRFFMIPAIVAFVALAAAYAFGGVGALFTVAILIVLEVTLSFDNAVVNAKVLRDVPPLWRKRFLTWGIAVAVFGTRLILPILIVSATSLTSPVTIVHLALFDPARYGALLGSARYTIDAFGACFLLLVALNFFLNDAKTIHWIGAIEKRLARMGKLESVELAIALLALLGISFFVPAAARAGTLIAGLVGVELFILLQSVIGFLSSGKTGAARGLSLFIYLEVLDTAFSFDGVTGAFAISTFIPLILLGLGVGAYFVRSITVYLVERKVLESLAYLEHGAHWAIFGLAIALFANHVILVPEFVTGSIGMLVVLAAYYSSVSMARRRASS